MKTFCKAFLGLKTDDPDGGTDPPSSTSEHPAVLELHATLDAIEQAKIPAARAAQRADDRRVVARNRRKQIERRAATLLPEAGIDPEDTGEFYVAPPVVRQG